MDRKTNEPTQAAENWSGDENPVSNLELERLRAGAEKCQKLLDLGVSELLCTETRRIMNLVYPDWIASEDRTIKPIAAKLRVAFQAARAASEAVADSIDPSERDKCEFAGHLQHNVSWRAAVVEVMTNFDLPLPKRQAQARAIIIKHQSAKAPALSLCL